MVAIATAIVVLVVNLAIRALALGPFQVPASALPLMPLIMASVGAVLGPALGCYLAFRCPGPDSMRKFLLPGAGFALMGIVIEMIRFAADHGDFVALAVGASQGLVAIGLALPILLRLVAHDRG
jgi:hypothetical protein